MRIISIGDNIDFPNDDDWLKIQFQFLINEMPVTDTSKKVKNVIRRRQVDGKWLCAAPYGYIINKQKEFGIVPLSVCKRTMARNLPMKWVTARKRNPLYSK